MSAATDQHRADRRQGRERGQALVEFALIAPLFVALVAGIIQFGVALNFWFDLQRLANQGARSAAVNCGPPSANQCVFAGGSNLETSLEGAKISRGNDPDAEICYVPPLTGSGGGAGVGDAVRVTLRTTYQFVPIIRVATVDLKAEATMRLEQVPNGGAAVGPLPDPAATPCTS